MLSGRGHHAVLAVVAVAGASRLSRIAFPQSEPPRLEGPVWILQGEQFETRVGTVTDVGIDAHSNIYVLDGARGAVDVFRSDGSFVAGASVDSRQVVAGKALAVSPTGRVFVLPVDGHKVVQLQLDGTTLRRLNWFPISVGGGDVCAGLRSVFVVGFDPQHPGLVHEYGFDGHLVRRFGGPLASDAPGSAVADFQGRIACSDDAVAVGSGFSPTVALYSDSGDLLWRSAVRPYRSLVIRPLPPDGYSLTIPPEGVDIVLGVLLFGRTVAVQVRRSGNVVPDLATLIFPAGPQSPPNSSTSSWPLIRRAYGAWALATVGQPHPRVEVYRIRERDER